MRLSELSTEQAADILCSITPFVTNIASDEELLSELKRAVSKDSVKTRAEMLAIGAEKISKLVPIILQKRKEDVFGILGVLNQKSAEEIAKQNFLATLKQARDIAKDKELIDFFKSCMGSEGSE